ncbi:MAG: metal ABC transporter substrate-binding protein [bacterium]
MNGVLITFRILTSFYPLYIATLNIAGDVPGVAVENLTGPQTGCLHDYQATPADLVRIAKAGAFIINGAGTESFLDKVMNPARIIDASAGIPLLDGNPHVWLNPAHAIRQVRNIEAALAARDPDHAADYHRNADAYAAKLETLNTIMHERLDTLPNRDIITFHEAFPYLADAFGLRIIAVIEREPGSEPGARELADIIDTVHRTGVQALFVEPQYPSASAETVARETGAKVYNLDPAVTGPMEKDAYVRIMEQNMQTLEKALR